MKNFWHKIKKSKLSIFAEIWILMKEHKKWWIGPIIVLLVMIGIVIVFAESSAIAPFIYTIF